MSATTPVRGVRRLELATTNPEPIADFYADLLGWAVIAEPDGLFSGWVGDRLALRVRHGDDGFHVVFAGSHPRTLREGAAVDTGRVLHGPRAPEPRPGEPCWVEFMGATDDTYWTGELGWRARTPDQPFTVYETTDEQQAVAGRLVGEQQQWTCYFAVPDITKTTEAAERIGGTVLVPPTEVPTGTVASIADPAGAMFALLHNPPGWGGTWSATA